MSEITVRTTYKEKLRPTPAQERLLEGVLWRCRELYNTALEQRITAWQRRHFSLSRYEQVAELKAIRAEFPEYAAIHSHVLQDVLARLDKTYAAFFRRIQRGERAGFPRFKGRTRYHSFTFKEYGNGARLDNGFLVLSTIGRISVHWSRPMEGRPKTVTICKEADGWYVAISCADVPLQPLPSSGQETGIDLGLESFATLADGARIFTPVYYRKAEAYLRRCQRRVARRKKGSHRRRKAVVLLAKAHQHIARQRRDFHHKEARKLVQAYDVIYHEDLRVANMVQNHHLAKSISDAGWGYLLTILAFKAASAGKRVQAVNHAFTSQRSSGPACGVIVTKGLSVRWHACPKCETSLHRDHNAALNILRLGPGRIHHCMRCIGAAQRALELMCERVTGRMAFGKPLAQQGVIQEWIAESAIEIEQARLLTLKAAWTIDTLGKKAAQNEIAMIKVVAPTVLTRVTDRAIQAFGGAGMSDDFPLAGMYAGGRALRLADGPDEVHKRAIARSILRQYSG
jgi:putative transposase